MVFFVIIYGITEHLYTAFSMNILIQNANMLTYALSAILEVVQVK